MFDGPVDALWIESGELIEVNLTSSHAIGRLAHCHASLDDLRHEHGLGRQQEALPGEWRDYCKGLSTKPYPGALDAGRAVPESVPSFS